MGIINEKSLANIQDIENMIDDRGNHKWYDLDRDVSEEQTNCILRSIQKAPFKAYPFYDQTELLQFPHSVSHSDYLKIALTNSEQGQLIKQYIWANIAITEDNDAWAWSKEDHKTYKNFVSEKYKAIFDNPTELKKRNNMQLFAPLVILYFQKECISYNDGPNCSKGVNLGVMATSALWCGMSMGLHNTFCGCINYSQADTKIFHELNRLLGISNNFNLSLMSCHGYSYVKNKVNASIKIKEKRESNLGPSIYTKIKKY